MKKSIDFSNEVKEIERILKTNMLTIYASKLNFMLYMKDDLYVLQDGNGHLITYDGEEKRFIAFNSIKSLISFLLVKSNFSFTYSII